MKVLNRRYLLGGAISLLIGVAAGGVFVDHLILQIAIPIVCAAVGISLLFFKRKFLGFALLLFALGTAILSADCAVGRADGREGYYTFSGRVCQAEENYYLFDEVSFDGERSSGKARGERVEFGELSVGDVVKGFVKTELLDREFYDFRSMSWYNARVYRTLTVLGTTEVVGQSKTVFDTVRERIREGLRFGLSSEDVGIAESLLFGDKSGLTEYDETLISGMGMSHVFAVSGLHVGFLTAAVVFLLKKLRVKHLPRIFVTAILLAIYGFLTGFPSGLKRASLMVLFYMLSTVVRGKPDGMTSLGAASFLIVLTNPRELFDLGFLMSFSAVLGILLFNAPISKGMKKLFRLRKNDRVADGVVLTLSANLFLLPVVLSVFRQIAPYAPIGNVLLLPIVTFLYIYLALLTPFIAVFSALGILLFPIRYPLRFIRIIGVGISSLPFSTLALPAFGAFCALYYFGLLFLSRLNLLPYKVKIPVSILCLAVSAVGFFI